MTAAELIAKWKKAALTERSAAQQHFLDLCELFDHPKPAADDPEGEHFTFEKGVKKRGGGEGWADVWKKGFFGWEYKGKHKSLDAAYDQLLQYREALENPPLLVVSDIERTIVRTNFTGTPTRTYEIRLADLGSPASLEVLRAVFYEPDRLKPGTISAAITTEAARRLGDVAQALRGRGLDPQAVAHFLDRVIFCLFAEDIGLLPNYLFTQLLDRTRSEPARFAKLLGELFAAMAHGGDFGLERIPHFNGDLFNAGPVLSLTAEEIESIRQAAQLDWSAVDASILGTLFERGMDPDKRSQIGAHYTSREDIEALVEPVVMQPLRREWAEARQVVENLLATGSKRPTGREKPPVGAALRKARTEAELILHRFLTRLANVKVLDPACGSGNFLYVTLQKLKDLEKEVITFGAERGFGGLLPLVGPWQLHGIEINAYAFELAQMSVWIGYLQWMRAHGYGVPHTPVLRRMDTFHRMDAILDLSDPQHPREPEWPAVDFIVGNPPFLGGKLMRRGLGDECVGQLFAVWRERVPPEADLCCYWFEKARKHIEEAKCKRAGLLATQGIRGGANQEVLRRIKETGDIFFAESDRPWILEGAAVHVSMVGFDRGDELTRLLDRRPVQQITPQLTAGIPVHMATHLDANTGVSFMGITPAGPFDIGFEAGLALLRLPNPTGVPNSDVIRPYVNGLDLNQRTRGSWTVDFGIDTALTAAAAYEGPFDHIFRHVKPIRGHNRRERYRTRWWIYAESRPAMRMAFGKHSRYLATCMVSKHRIYVWLPTVVLPANVVIVFARSDDYFLGVLHSRLHEVWARMQGTQLRERESGFRYTPTTCFETFPFPEPTPEQEAAIAAAVKELDALRNRWLNPPEWVREEALEFPGSVDGPWARYVHDPDERGIGTVRYPCLVPRDAECAKQLAQRTLTNLYNQRPAWLELAHRKLDNAVCAAYGWDPGLSDEQILARLLALNQERAAGEQ